MSVFSDFDIWIEIDTWFDYKHIDVAEQFCNVVITFPDSSTVGLNVWSEAYFFNYFNQLTCQQEQPNNEYILLPDLVVKHFDSDAIRKVVIKLIQEDNWLQGRGLPARDEID